MHFNVVRVYFTERSSMNGRGAFGNRRFIAFEGNRKTEKSYLSADGKVAFKVKEYAIISTAYAHTQDIG